MSFDDLEPVVPSLPKAVEPAVTPVPAGACKVQPRWADEDNVQRWRLKFRVQERDEPDVTGRDGTPEDHKTWTELELRPFTRELPLSGMRHGENHFFKVAIETPDGWSHWSRIVSCVPPSPEKPGKCASVLASVKSPTSALVRWTPPLDYAGAISCGTVQKYKLLVTWPEAGETKSRDILIEEQLEEKEVTDLECCHEYRFMVAAENVSGWGEWSDASAVLNMPLPVPSAPAAPLLRRATHYSVVAQWYHPAEGGAPIESFRFRYTNTGDWRSGVTEVPDVSAELTQEVIENLLPGQTYIFQVRAANKYGLSLWSESSRPIKTMDGGVPAKISEFTAKDVFKTFVTVQWRPPFENGFAIIGHIMRYDDRAHMQKAKEFEPIVVREKGVDRCDIGHLEKKMYYFQVAAINAMGRADWSDPVMVDMADIKPIANVLT